MCSSSLLQCHVLNFFCTVAWSSLCYYYWPRSWVQFKCGRECKQQPQQQYSSLGMSPLCPLEMEMFFVFNLALMVLSSPTGFITCAVLPCQPLIFAIDSLPFQLASLPWVHCLFNWLHCHRFIAVSMASLPWIHHRFNWLHCPHGIIVNLAGFIASSWVHCLSNSTAANQLLPCNYHWRNVIGHQTPFAFWHPICLSAPHLPFGAPFAFRRPICLSAPHLPFGTPFAFWRPIYLSAPRLPSGAPIPSDVQFQYLWQKVTCVNVPPSHPIF